MKTLKPFPRVPFRLVLVLGAGMLLSDALIVVATVRLLRTLRTFVAASRQIRKASLQSSAEAEVRFLSRW